MFFVLLPALHSLAQSVCPCIMTNPIKIRDAVTMRTMPLAAAKAAVVKFSSVIR